MNFNILNTSYNAVTVGSNYPPRFWLSGEYTGYFVDVFKALKI